MNDPLDPFGFRKAKGHSRNEHKSKIVFYFKEWLSFIFSDHSQT